MRRRFAISCVIVIFFLGGIQDALSQVDRMDIVIEWKEIIKDKDEKFLKSDGETKYFINFEGAIYPDHFTSLPFFSGKIKSNNPDKGYEYFAVIENMVFEELPTKELEIVMPNGQLEKEITVVSKMTFERKTPFVVYNFLPFRYNQTTAKTEKLTRFSISLKKRLIKPKQTNRVKKVNKYATTSVLSTGKWNKIRIKESGIYKLTYSQLIDMGFDQPGSIRLFGNVCSSLPFVSNGERIDDLRENKIKRIDGNDGSFDNGDYFIFYGQSPVKWTWNSDRESFDHNINIYSDYTYYFITDEAGTGLRTSILESLNEEADIVVNSFNDYSFYDNNDTTFIKSGRIWYGEHFGMDLDHSFDFSFPGLIKTEEVKLTSSIICRTPRLSPNSSFLISSGGTSIENIVFNGINMDFFENPFALSKTEYSSFNSDSDDINISITFNKSTGTSEGWLDYLTMNARRNLRMNSDQMLFRDQNSVGIDVISEFQLSGASDDIRIWEITDPTRPSEVEVVKNGELHSFKLKTEVLRQFIAFSTAADNYLIPEITGLNLGDVPNQNLHQKPQADMIIIYNKVFEDYARELGEFHKNNDGLSVVTVDQEEVFNEFSSGGPDVVAIRDFVKMFYDRAVNENDMPKYLLLYGDGSYDNKTISNRNSNFILTYQSEESLDPVDSYVTDDFFGLLDDEEDFGYGMLDIGVGRIPVRDAQQAAAMNKKIFHYSDNTTFGDWRNQISFVADDGDGNLHMRDADGITQKINNSNPEYNIEKIYLDAYQQVSTSGGQFYPEVNTAINQRIKRGVLIFNYIGHGSELGLAHERILGISDIKKWSNNNKLPLFVTATCEFSRFDDYNAVSAGEWVFLNQNGGAIALFTTTRLAFSAGNKNLNTKFYENVFEKDANGEPFRLGDILRLTKNNSGWDQNKLNFTLLGDPAIKLAYPGYKIKTSSINDKQITAITDTLKAFSLVTVAGYIENKNGEKFNEFNGIVYPTVYDKSVTTNNLSNDGTPIMHFDVMNSIIYKGKASIINGEFSFSFIVPKDISYKYGFGKLSYYADNSEVDASGMENRFIIGGSMGLSQTDNEGPEIELYMNDNNFVFGGTTDENPSLFAMVSDTNGINTTNGVGHDITAILDDNTKQTFLLNDFYEAGLNDYKTGTVKFPLSELETGSHNLKFKVWDTFNNSSEDYIEFIVAGSEEMVIKHLLNYPNPFTTKTSFYFEHNRANQDLDVLIQVITISGKLVKSIEFLSALGTQVNSDSYRIGPIEWDGLDDYGDPIGRGTYIYRVKVSDNNGDIVEKYQKLVVLK
ncbi:type IX secretion system sortase PorU [Bacteroidota bacterium]